MPVETPSKSALLEIRAERELVDNGKAILEQQRERLAQEMIALIHQLEAMQPQFAARFVAARTAIRGAIVRHGLQGVQGFRFATALAAPQWRERNLLGTRWLETRQTAVTTPPELGTGWEISLELEQAVIAFQRLLEMTVHYAMLQNNLQRLTQAFRRSQRRVNALEHIILPELRTSIREMENTLDEMEREEQVRARFAKRRQEAKAATSGKSQVAREG